MTGIEWTGATWNPTTGCDRVSAGCDNCYALTMARRLKAMGQAKYQTDGDPRTSGPGFGLAIHPDSLDLPLRRRAPQTWFVNSMSDLGHARIPWDFMASVWAVMAQADQHTYQILSKRPERLRRFLADECRCGKGHAPEVHLRSAMDWAGTPHNPARVPGVDGSTVYYDQPLPLPNVHLGTSIELDEYARRADDLRQTRAAVRFLSLEPLLGPLPSLSLAGIDWAIIGGESGGGARPMDLGWARDLIARCRETGTAVFVKQLGSVAGREIGAGPHGADWAAWPDDLRIREFPRTVPGVPA